MANQILNAKYNDLDALIPSLEVGTYDLTVDCEGVENTALKELGNKLKLAKDNVLFNIKIFNIGSSITDTSSMFLGCNNILCVDTNELKTVTNATSMFSNCKKLSKVLWGSSFKPETKADMFYGINSLITFVASKESEEWITQNAVSMSLLNYNINYDFNSFNYHLSNLIKQNQEISKNRDEWEKKAQEGGSEGVDLNIKYSELDTEIPKLKPFSTCNLTVDCTGVDPSEFTTDLSSNDIRSPFWRKLSNIRNIGINLTLKNLPNTVVNMTCCFYPEIKMSSRESFPYDSNLISINFLDSEVKITNAGGMFFYNNFLTSIDTSGFTSVANAGWMFNGCSSLTSIDTSAFISVNDAQYMFQNCSSLTSIDTSGFTSVTNAEGMFANCSSLTSITWAKNFLPDEYAGMFSGCNQQINIITEDWYTNTYITNNASYMGLTNYKLLNEYPKPDVPILESLKYSELTRKYMMLYDPRPEPYNLTVDCTGVAASEFIGDDYNASLFGSKLNTAPSGVYFNLTPTNVGSDVTNANWMFNNCSNLTSIDTSGFTSVTNADYMFSGCSSLTSITWGDSFRPTNFSYMFYEATATKTITASADSQKWIKDNASNMSLFVYVFGEKSEPIILTYTQLDAELASLEPKYIYNLTVNCEGVDNQTLKSFGSKLNAAPSEVYFNLTPTNVGSDVTNTTNMFLNCSSLTSIDTSGFTNVTNAEGMFRNCSNLTSIDTSAFTKVTDADFMFLDCSSLTNITWGDSFRPTSHNSMFSNVTAKTIKASTDSQKWINTNASTMSLSNYTINVKA